MVDESGGICLNIAKLPVAKKKAKSKNESGIAPRLKKTVDVTPKIVGAKAKTIQPVGILKKPKPVASQSVWKKFKQSNKKGDDPKPGFLKPAKQPAKKKVKVSEAPEIVEPILQSTNDAAPVARIKRPKSNKSQEELLEAGDKMLKNKKYSNFTSEPEHRTGKSTSLFGNNPEIPAIPHRAVKPVKEAVFSNVNFEDVDLHPFMVKYLKESMGLTKMTTVQEKSIPVLLKKKDALIRSQTGSGKTLAYALPILQRIQEIRPKINRSDGVLALVVVPTRELALQTYELFNKLVKSYTWIVPGYLVGGEKRKSEKARLRKGISILIGTPGRLIDHVQHTKALNLDKVSWLVIDEADRLLDMGYEKDVSVLLDTLNQDDSTLLNPSYLNPEEKPKEKKPNTRQTVLLSATLTQKVEKLAGLSLKNPVFVDACEENLTTGSHVPVFSSDIGTETDTMVLPESLVQKYVVTPPKLKLVTLTSFILWKSKLTEQRKMLIFIATQDMVDYYTELLSSILSSKEEADEDLANYSNSGIELFKLHGNMKQNERTEVFKTFRKCHLGVLLCTDVASRGLDLPEVDWVIQYTGPTSVSDYVHRVGRTARGGQSGSSIIFLTPNEVSFIGKLENCQIRLQEEKMETCLDHLLSVNPRGRTVQEEATRLQSKLENLVASRTDLYDLACKGYASWCRFYASYPRSMRDAFSVKAVHQGHQAKSFALRDTPSVIVNYARRKNLNEKRHGRKRPREAQEKGFRPGTGKLANISEYDSGLEPVSKRKK